MLKVRRCSQNRNKLAHRFFSSMIRKVGFWNFCGIFEKSWRISGIFLKSKKPNLKSRCFSHWFRPDKADFWGRDKKRWLFDRFRELGPNVQINCCDNWEMKLEINWIIDSILLSTSYFAGKKSRRYNEIYLTKTHSLTVKTGQ